MSLQSIGHVIIASSGDVIHGDYLLGGGDGRFVRTLEPYSPERSTFRLLLNPTSGPNFKGQSEFLL